MPSCPACASAGRSDRQHGLGLRPGGRAGPGATTPPRPRSSTSRGSWLPTTRARDPYQLCLSRLDPHRLQRSAVSRAGARRRFRSWSNGRFLWGVRARPRRLPTPSRSSAATTPVHHRPRARRRRRPDGNQSLTGERADERDIRAAAGQPWVNWVGNRSCTPRHFASAPREDHVAGWWRPQARRAWVSGSPRPATPSRRRRDGWSAARPEGVERRARCRCRTPASDGLGGHPDPRLLPPAVGCGSRADQSGRHRHPADRRSGRDRHPRIWHQVHAPVGRVRRVRLVTPRERSGRSPRATGAAASGPGGGRDARGDDQLELEVTTVYRLSSRSPVGVGGGARALGEWSRSTVTSGSSGSPARSQARYTTSTATGSRWPQVLRQDL